MDLKATLNTFKKKAAPFVKTAKLYGGKAMDFTVKQASATPLFIQNEEAYNIHATAKRSILIAFDETDPTTKNIALLFPLWGSQAWMDAAELRYLSLTEQSDLAKTLGISGPIELHVSYEGTEYLKTNDLKEISAWWKNRCYTHVTAPLTPAETTQTSDPLANIK